MKKFLITLISAIFVLGGTSLAYTSEQKDAYNYAYTQKITTAYSIENANMNGSLTRIAMAKMISYFAVNVLGLKPDTSKNCSFSDVSNSLDSQYNYGVTQACQLGLMGIGNDGKKSDKFNPYVTVTRGQFATVLSRALSQKNGDTVWEGQPYYKRHLQYLNNKGIIKNVNIPTPDSYEKRGNVMIMMYRYGQNEKVTENIPSIKDGRQIEYYDNGKVRKISNYKDGKLNGEYVEYFEDGSVASKGSYKNGELDGYWIRYCEKGNTQCTSLDGNYKDGKQVFGVEQYGTFNAYAYRSNGQVQSAEYQDNNGNRNGDYVSFYENGQLKEQGQYKNNKKTGEWIKYFEDGSVASKGSYKNGELDGYWIRYCEKGDDQCISLDGNYENGKQIFGVEQYGTFNSITYWSNEQIQSAEYRDSDGKLNGDYVSFYENGQLKEQGQYKDNAKTGEWIEYFQDGSVASKGSYKNGKLDGYWIRYCEKGDDQCTSLDGNYEDGKQIID